MVLKLGFHILEKYTGWPKRKFDITRAQKRAAHPNLFHFPQTGERNDLKYQCDLCVRGFNARDSLLQHRARHTASGPHEAWTCLLCNAKFEYYRDMVKHKETTHADEPLVKIATCTAL